MLCNEDSCYLPAARSRRTLVTLLRRGAGGPLARPYGEEQEDPQPVPVGRSRRTLSPSLRGGARGRSARPCGEGQEDSQPLPVERSKRTLSPSLRRGGRGLLGGRCETTYINTVMLKSVTFEVVAHLNTTILCLNIVIMDEETGLCHTDSYCVACFISFDLLV